MSKSIKRKVESQWGAIFEGLEIYDNSHLTGDMDYFHQLLEHFDKRLKQKAELSSIKNAKKTILKSSYMV